MNDINDISVLFKCPRKLNNMTLKLKQLQGINAFLFTIYTWAFLL